MQDITLECLLLYSRPSWYTIVMIILSSWYLVFMIFFLSHYETGKMHQLDLIKYTYTTCTMLYVRSLCLI